MALKSISGPGLLNPQNLDKFTLDSKKSLITNKSFTLNCTKVFSLIADIYGMLKKLLVVCIVVMWAFIPPAKSEFTIDMFERAIDAEPLIPLSGDEINGIPLDLTEMNETAEKMSEYITKVEEQIVFIQKDIVNIQEDINKGLNMSTEELEKFAKAQVDIAEQETHNGIVYDIDIYDHAKKLAIPSWDEFKEKYNI